MLKSPALKEESQNARLRVGLSTSVIQGARSGVGQYVLALVRALLDSPDPPHLTLFILENDRPLFDFAQGRAKCVHVPERFRPPVRNIAWHHTMLPSLARRLGLDVLHIPSYRRLLFRQPCALVATIHDLAPFHVHGKYDPARMFYGRVIVKRLARRQHRLIAVSTNTARDVQKFFGIPIARQQVILNGIDHQRFFPGPVPAAKIIAANRWDLHAPFFLYISRLEHPAKNHIRLIEAFNRFKATTGSPWLLVLGGSDWHGAERIHHAARTSPYVQDIRFLGFVEDAVLPDLYRAADTMVYPSLFEGFGLPPAEAMACGCPVLSSRRGSLDEVVADAAQTLDPESVDSITQGLAQMAAGDSLREALRAKGLANARRFAWSDNAAHVLRAYRAALDKYYAQNP